MEACIAIREPTVIPCAAPASSIIRDGASHFARMKGPSGPDIDLRNDCKMLADGSCGDTVDGEQQTHIRKARDVHGTTPREVREVLIQSIT